MAIGERQSQYNLTGGAVVVAGIVASAVSMFALSWTTVRDGRLPWFDGKFEDLDKLMGLLDDPPFFTELYFGWLGLALLIAAAVVGLAAQAPSSAQPLLRRLGAGLGTAGAVATVYGYMGDRDFSDIFEAADIGLWVAIGGFVLIAIGSSVGRER